MRRRYVWFDSRSQSISLPERKRDSFRLTGTEEPGRGGQRSTRSALLQLRARASVARGAPSLALLPVTAWEAHCTHPRMAAAFFGFLLSRSHFGSSSCCVELET